MDNKGGGGVCHSVRSSNGSAFGGGALIRGEEIALRRDRYRRGEGKHS